MLGLKKYILLSAALLLVWSCSNQHAQDKISTDNFHGHYKIGKPYEVEGKTYYPRPQPDYDEVGIASWYGSEFHGKKTANGDTFDKNALTGAHNTLPLPSMVRVTNLENNKTLIVMVNDRGPFSRGRVIDLSERAADILGFKNKGIAKVRVQFLEGHTKRLLSDLPNSPKIGEGNKFLSKVDNAPVSIIPSSPATSFLGAPVAQAQKNEEPEALGAFARLKKQNEKYDSFFWKKKQDELDIFEEKYNTAQVAGNMKYEPRINIEQNKDNYQIGKLPEITIESNQIAESLPVNEDSNNNVISDVVVESEIEEIVENKIVVADKEDKAGKEEDLYDYSKPNMASKIPGLAQDAGETVEEEMMFVQAGTYSIKRNAERVEKKLSKLGDIRVRPMTRGDQTLYRVQVGPMKNTIKASLALQKVMMLGHPDAVIVKDMIAVNYSNLQ